tara:strand:- start:15 stop:170 length:156 start_codon:yes stop_codon:yes gene_type:complete
LAKTKPIEQPKPTLDEKIAQVENELKQIEAEYHKRVGKLEALKELKGICQC